MNERLQDVIFHSAFIKLWACYLLPHSPPREQLSPGKCFAIFFPVNWRESPSASGEDEGTDYSLRNQIGWGLEGGTIMFLLDNLLKVYIIVCARMCAFIAAPYF